ncbi:alpha/beta hydrolase family protein [Nonomuraea sp. NPDC050556]|uniref:alpha/beta hydrolase family protein n=1 Tax=Nonomuraea sp. NPDC050556 TaxID=3364369 RepID=UPI00379B2FF9
MMIVVLVAAVALVLVRWLPAGARLPVTVVAVVALVVGAVTVGYRWQVAPILAGGAVALAFAVPPLLRPGRTAWRAKWWLALPGSLACLGLVAAGGGAAWALPLPEFPEPTGPHAVGTTVMQWSGKDRIVVAQIWYPARKSPAPGAQYVQREVTGAVADYLGVPGFLLDELPRARTHAVTGAPVDAGRFAVVLFSPGLGGVRSQNTAWAEELASRGYVVAALDHLHDSAAVVLADGSIVRTRVRSTGDDAADRRLAAGWSTARAADLSFALTELGRSRLAGSLDLERVAVTGHSIGGSAALQAARLDSRFDAVVDLDGYPHDPAPGPFHQPVLALTHELAPGENPGYLPRLRQVLALSTGKTRLVTVPGTAHLTFTDAPLYLPPLPGLVGSLGRTEGVRITVEQTAAFLGAALYGRPY